MPSLHIQAYQLLAAGPDSAATLKCKNYRQFEVPSRGAGGTGGVYVDARRGISRGCALGQLIGAFYLETLDAALSRSGL